MFRFNSRNIFIEALHPRLRDRVRERCPATIEDALWLALQYEGFDAGDEENEVNHQNRFFQQKRSRMSEAGDSEKQCSTFGR